MPAKKTRRKFLVHRQFQFRYLIQMVGIVFFFTVVNTFCVYLGIHAQLKKEFSEKKFEKQLELLAKLKIVEESPEFKKRSYNPQLFENPDLLNNYQGRVLANILQTTNRNLFLMLAISLPLVAVLSIVLSHRVVGSLERVKKILHMIQKGDLTIDIKTRKLDELKELTEEIVFIAKRWRERFKEVRSKIERIEKTNESIQEAHRDHEKEESTRNLLRQLEREVKELSSLLAQFRIEA